MKPSDMQMYISSMTGRETCPVGAHLLQHIEEALAARTSWMKGRDQRAAGSSSACSPRACSARYRPGWRTVRSEPGAAVPEARPCRAPPARKPDLANGSLIEVARDPAGSAVLRNRAMSWSSGAAAAARTSPPVVDVLRPLRRAAGRGAASAFPADGCSLARNRRLFGRPASGVGRESAG